jgi:hypothetical protein
VVDCDDQSGTVRIQMFDGSLDEIEEDAWRALSAEPVEQPEDWTGPLDNLETDDLESMACGTPVIAFACGSVPEVIEDGVTGFVVMDIDAAVRAVGRLVELDRREIRRRFEQRFAVARMASNYLEIYQQLVRAPAPQLRIA